ncbi:GDP-L-fucose synthase [Microbaculum marinum]|uniref:GDP-L-fucose synthase n=1 Tax=Microbaculum marinum TaxID=1764581 RepID=A0AAW9RSW1_9HYPH
MSYDLAGKRVWVAGHRGMVGSALMRRLADEDCELLTVGREEVDLRRQAETEDWLAEARPELVFLAAARVGGILANRDHPASFLYDNLMIEANVMEAARRCGTEKLVLLGSSCIYPKYAPQPIREEALLTGPLEPTNEAYAIAKIAGIKLAESYRAQHGCRFISAQPSNLYGPGDNFDPASSHVLAALLRRAHEAKTREEPEMIVWGTGAPLREFLHVDDLADALVFLACHYEESVPINVGTGEEITIRGLAELIAEVVGYGGALRFDTSKPDGTPRKVVDASRLAGLGWRASTPLAEGIRGTYAWFAARQGTARGMAAMMET